MSNSKRYFDHSRLSLDGIDAGQELLDSLQRIVEYCPPVLTDQSSWRLHGLYSGPTSVAYLFLRLSKHYPDLRLNERSLLDLTEEYLNLAARLGPVPVDPDHCGIANDTLAQLAVRAYMGKNKDMARQLCSYSEMIVFVDHGSDEWLYGRSGYLYFLRLVLSAFDASLDRETYEMIEKTIRPVVRRIRSTSHSWKWHGKPYLGAAHGSIGIICQAVLSMPIMADPIEPLLTRLLDTQFESGNFPSAEGSQADSLVQFCHGGPGWVLALSSIRSYLPRLQTRIDASIETAAKDIWDRGLLTKTPCLCHGIAGNALALDSDEQFGYFLAHMTSDDLKVRGSLDRTQDCNDFVGLYTGEAGRAWVWFLADKKMKRLCIGFNDV